MHVQVMVTMSWFMLSLDKVMLSSELIHPVLGVSVILLTPTSIPTILHNNAKQL